MVEAFWLLTDQPQLGRTILNDNGFHAIAPILDGLHKRGYRLRTGRQAENNGPDSYGCSDYN